MGLPAVQINARDPLDLLDVCIEGLRNQRGATRVQFMEALGRALERLPPLDELDRRSLNIFALCGVSIKNAAAKSNKEARHAYRAVGLLALALPARRSSILLAQSFSLLSKMLPVQALHDDAPTLAAALDSLAAVTFVRARDMEVELSMKATWAVICPPPSRSTKLFLPSNERSTTKLQAWKTTTQVLAAALSTWTFLLATVTITQAQLKANRAAWNATIASLAELLENNDRTVRMAAGKALAVCMELNLTQHVPCKDMEALAAKVRDLAIEAGGKGVNKTMLPEQRHLFRLIVGFVDHGERPKESVTVRVLEDGSREMLMLSTWATLVQLSFPRRFFGNGFPKHVQGNELFKKAFDINVKEVKCLLVAQRKAMSKMKDKRLNMMRDDRWECKNVFGLAGE